MNQPATISLESALLLVEEAMKTQERQKFLQLHKYKLYQGKDGRWFTRFPKPDGGSIQKAFKTEEDALDAIVSFYKKREDQINDVKEVEEVNEES